MPERRPRRALRVLAALVVAAVACNAPARRDAVAAQADAAYAPRADGRALDVPALTALGRALFFDASLSASGRTACASCHDPAHAWGPPNDHAVQLAGRDGATPGLRAAPSLRYLAALPAFTEHHFDNDGDDSIDAGPTGGYTWDGRAGSAREQALLPLLSPQEMANGSPRELLERVRRGPLAARLRQVFDATVLDEPERALRAVAFALEVFQQSPAEFYPFSSRYDEVLRGRAELTPREARGLALFNDPAKGNCAACHLSEVRPDGGLPLFTDFGLIAIGVPRNRALRANSDPSFFDLGLCGPLRTDFSDRPEYCGRFRTPTLRNVALRRVFFHNGVFRTLEDVLRFYARRDTHPQEFYPREAAGRVQPFDDLPASYHGNVNVEPPFDRHAGEPPALDEAEIADIVVFLRTLTDADLVRPVANR